MAQVLIVLALTIWLGPWVLVPIILGIIIIDLFQD